MGVGDHEQHFHFASSPCHPIVASLVFRRGEDVFSLNMGLPWTNELSLVFRFWFKTWPVSVMPPGNHTWFQPENHVSEVRSFMRAWSGSRTLSCLDVFGGSQSLAKVFQARGYQAVSYDILIGNRAHDITSQTGFMVLLGLGLSLVAGGLLSLAPPCSLYVFFSSSRHMRSLECPYGDETSWKVNLSNRIVLSMVAWLKPMCSFFNQWLDVVCAFMIFHVLPESCIILLMSNKCASLMQS